MSLLKLFQKGAILSKLVPSSNIIIRSLSTNGVPALNKKTVSFTFIKYDGTRIKTTGNIGDSLLDVIVNNSLDIEGYGCCEGTLTCSTCHVVLKKQDFEKLPDEPSPEEGDMLELANEACETSRLGCQVFLSEEMEGIEIKVPESIDIREES